MNGRIKRILMISAYLFIPFLSVLICRGLEIAQGEKNEEIIFGLMVGLFLDFVYSVVLVLLDKVREKTR